MANEATLNYNLSIRNGNLFYRSGQTTFRIDVDGAKGPSPGALTVSLLGTDVDLSELSTPGLCIIRNLDDTNFVEVGIYDGQEFYPLMEVLPGESYPLRLSRFLGTSIGSSESGTGTYDFGTYRLRIKAVGAPCDVSVEAFEA